MSYCCFFSNSGQRRLFQQDSILADFERSKSSQEDCCNVTFRERGQKRREPRIEKQ